MSFLRGNNDDGDVPQEVNTLRSAIKLAIRRILSAVMRVLPQELLLNIRLVNVIL